MINLNDGIYNILNFPREAFCLGGGGGEIVMEKIMQGMDQVLF